MTFFFGIMPLTKQPAVFDWHGSFFPVIGSVIWPARQSEGRHEPDLAGTDLRAGVRRR